MFYPALAGINLRALFSSYDSYAWSVLRFVRFLRRPLYAGALLCAVCLVPLHGQALNTTGFDQATGTLSSVASIRHLTPEQATQKVPVHLVGVVTALSGFGQSFFVQDGTAGIAVDRTDTLEVHVGDQVEITGVSNPGYFAPTVISSKVVIQGQSPLPRPLPVTYVKLNGGLQDSQWVEVEGVVHTARMGTVFDKETLILGLDVGGNAVKLLIQDYAGIDYQHLVDAEVRVRGVAATEFNEKRQFLGISFFVPRRSDLEVLQPANPDPFAGPTLPVRNAYLFGQVPHRVKVAGIVTWQNPGHFLFIQEGEDGIGVKVASPEVLELGTPIEVAGFPAMGEYAPILEGAIFRVVGKPHPISPIRIHASEVILQDSYFNRARHDGQLVQIQGKVIESRYEGVIRTLIMGEQNQIFEAVLAGAGVNAKRILPNGSIVSLTGVCTIVSDEEHSPTSFEIKLRSEEDIVIVKKASWWTAVHALWILSLAVAGMVIVVLWVLVLRNRVERQTYLIRKSEERFRELAERDVLTGLPNRLGLEEHISACLQRCQENQRRAAVMTIDIDRFKHINDTYGHAAGDECLKVVASRLRNAGPETDTIARTGGEEFTLVAGGLNSAEDAERISSAILDLFRDPVVLGELEIVVTVSVGCGIYPDDGVETAELLKRSDQALYEAKRTGRNRVVFATHELNARFDKVAATETAVRNALRTGTFTLAYQPIYDAAGTMRRMEALLRTSDPLLGSVGPAAYVPVAEGCGVILPLGRWVLQAVCRHIVAWKAAGMDVCPIAVNISASQLLQHGFAEDVLQILESFDLHPSVMEFELTESVAMADFDAVIEKMNRLARAGVTFSIDDYGNGSSSIARLYRLPIKSLKINRGFVQNAEGNSGTHTVMKAVIKMAPSLNLQTVAVGIERQEQFDLLRAYGCDLFQGFLLARPMPAVEITKILVQKDVPVLSVAS